MSGEIKFRVSEGVPSGEILMVPYEPQIEEMLALLFTPEAMREFASRCVLTTNLGRTEGK